MRDIESSVYLAKHRGYDIEYVLHKDGRERVEASRNGVVEISEVSGEVVMARIDEKVSREERFVVKAAKMLGEIEAYQQEHGGGE